jgi:hypothetical protein
VGEKIVNNPEFPVYHKNLYAFQGSCAKVTDNLIAGRSEAPSIVYSSDTGLALDNKMVDGNWIEANDKSDSLSRPFMMVGCKCLIVYSTSMWCCDQPFHKNHSSFRLSNHMPVA